jgi:hypothetical protein
MMADFLGLQQPPTKKFRSGPNSSESGIKKNKYFFKYNFTHFFLSRF